MTVQGFEGFEKRLEIEFRQATERLHVPIHGGLRQLGMGRLTEILTAAQCTIVSTLSNNAFDSYVLSESSLFVYPLKIIIKTCGTTQLLKSVPPLLRHARNMGLKPYRCRYSRGTFLFPRAQPFPHRSFDEEVQYLNRYFGGPASYSCVLSGDPDRINWHLYTAGNNSDTDSSSSSYTLEVCMTELDRTCASKFYKAPGNSTASEMTLNSGIQSLLPNSKICDFAFEPCGYSMNGIEGEGYSTIHVTPEDGYSYASFELMGYDPHTIDLQDILDRVAAVFKPATLSFSLHTNEDPTRTDSLNSWLRPAHPRGYVCMSASRQELPAAAGTVVFNTFSKVAKNGETTRSKMAFGILEAEEEHQPRVSIGYHRLWCGLDAGATRSLQNDAIPSSS